MKRCDMCNSVYNDDINICENCGNDELIEIENKKNKRNKTEENEYSYSDKHKQCKYCNKVIKFYTICPECKEKYEEIYCKRLAIISIFAGVILGCISACIVENKLFGFTLWITIGICNSIPLFIAHTIIERLNVIANPPKRK